MLDWRERAKCRKLDDSEVEETFWIGPGKSANQARLFCASCPVKLECRDYAIVYKERGIWGGTTEEERDNLPGFIAEHLRAQALAAGMLECRNIAEFINTKPKVLIDLDLDQEVLRLEELLQEAQDLLFEPSNVQQAS